MVDETNSGSDKETKPNANKKPSLTKDSDAKIETSSNKESASKKESNSKNNAKEKKPQSNTAQIKSTPSDKKALDKLQAEINQEKKREHSAAPNETIEQSSPSELFTAKPMPKLHSKPSKKSWLVPSLISLLIIIALLTSGWTFYQQQKINESWASLQNNLNSEITKQNKNIESATSSSQHFMQNANQTQLQLNQLSVKNKQLTDSLLSTQERIKSLSGRKKQDWMLAEAAYLIRAAQLQLSLQKDKHTAIQLLKTADQRIITIADNSLLPIREAIARDISELNLIMEVDITGIALTLNAINQQVGELNILALQFQPLEESINTNKDTVTEEEGFSLNKIYQGFLRDFVNVKDHSEPRKPLMTPEQRANLNSNIQLAIQQAQIALVQGNEKLYQLNIDNATKWIDEFFEHDSKANLVTEQLNGLKKMPIETRYPTKLASQNALSDISQQQLYRWLDDSQSSLGTKIIPTPPASSNTQSEEQIDQEQEEQMEIKP